MAGDLGALFSWIMELFRYEFTIYGVTFSMWDVFAFSIVACVIGWFIGRLLLDD